MALSMCSRYINTKSNKNSLQNKNTKLELLEINNVTR